MSQKPLNTMTIFSVQFHTKSAVLNGFMSPVVELSSNVTMTTASSSSSSSILFTKYSNKQKHVTYREIDNMA